MIPPTELAGAILAGAVASSGPVVFAATGEVLSERAGVLNLGVEGAMLLGGAAAAGVLVATGSPALAVLAGAAAGAAPGLAHGLLVTLGGVGMVASGLCLFFVARGLSAFWGYGLSGRPVAGFDALRVPGLADLPVVGPGFFAHEPLTYGAVLAPVLAWLFLFRTRWGLRVRAAGANAEVARAEGVRVTRVRVAMATAGAALAGVGGAQVVLSFSHTWIEGVTAGRGWVALGLVVLARWNPLWVFPAALLFGGAVSLQLHAQATGTAVSTYWLAMLPYVVTIAALLLARVWARGAAMPAELTRTEA